MATLLLLDGNSLTYRAFYALPTDLVTASGQVTNAVLGFTSMLVNLVRDHRPDGVAVAFDRPEPTFRHEAYPAYKAQRDATPDILVQQLGLVRQVAETLGITVVEAPGFEADDVLATLATAARDAGDDVIVVTGDRDTYQLVEDPHVKVLYNRRGVSDYVLYDEAGVQERTGVTPAQYPLFAALRGDPSDNLPGVPGVGEKTAAKLVVTYGSLDELYAHLGDLSPKLRASLAEAEAQVRANAAVTPLVRDVPLEVDLAGVRLGPVDADEVRRLFEFLEFRRLYERLGEAFGPQLAAASSPAEPLRVGLRRGGAAELGERLAGWAAGVEPVGVAVAADGPGPGAAVLGVAVAPPPDPGDDEAAAWWVPAGDLDDPAVAGSLRDLLDGSGPGFVTHEAKLAMRRLRGRGLDARGLVMDVALAGYLLDPGEQSYPLGALVERYVGRELHDPHAVPEGQLDLSGQVADPAEVAGRAAAGCAALVRPLVEALDAQGLRRLHDEVETPLVRVLARMEEVGVGVDVERLRALQRELTAEVERLTSEVWDAAGVEFNLNSTPQLRTVLYDKLGLAPGKKTKTGYSTDAATLEKLRGEHPVVELLLAYREAEKLRSTYGEGLLAEVAADGRIHATFNQTVARTGRLSSDAPNLHNIPVRTPLGRRFREAFVPAPGYELLVADYNQIELRCIAHLAEDPGLIAAFEAGDDIHTATAARVFGVDAGAVTPEQRAKAKMVSYGLAYGMEAYGLGQRLGIPTEEAAGILAAYFEAFPNVKASMERAVAEARSRGYTETLFGRRRPIPELTSRNLRVRQAGERQAMNAGIQGLAADIFKIALVRLDAALETGGGGARLVLQVHDEVLVEVPPAVRDEVEALTRTTMEHAADLRVPLAVNLAVGPSWAGAKA